jgi:hypothetical protein
MPIAIHLEHPQHGRKIAYLQKEAEADKKNGWVEVTKEQFYHRPKKEIPVVKQEEVAQKLDDEREKLVSEYEAKFGKKPHHRMNETTIREALNG